MEMNSVDLLREELTAFEEVVESLGMAGEDWFSTSFGPLLQSVRTDALTDVARRLRPVLVAMQQLQQALVAEIERREPEQ